MASTRAASVVLGLDKMERNLRKVADTLTGERTLGSGLLAAAAPVRDEASRLAPRSETPGGTTGRGHAADEIASLLVRTRSGRALEAHIGPPAWGWYLAFPEFGTLHQPAVGMFRRAADSKFDEAEAAFVEHMRPLIRGAIR